MILGKDRIRMFFRFSEKKSDTLYLVMALGTKHKYSFPEYLTGFAVNAIAQSCKGQAFSEKFSLCIDGRFLPGLTPRFVH